MRSSAKYLTLACALLASCGDSKKEEPKIAKEEVLETPPPTAPLIATRRVGTYAAFDWIWRKDHPALVWGPPGKDGGGLLMLDLDTLGASAGREEVLVPSKAADERGGKVLEVAATANADKMAIAWVQEEARKATSYVMTGDLDGARRSNPRSLGRMLGLPARSNGHVRGHIDVALHPDGMPMVFRQIGPKKCERGLCMQFRLHSVGRGDRRDVPLLVKSPCKAPVIGLTMKAHGFQYGLCSREDAAHATLYSISFDPEYAEATPLLQGCSDMRLSRSAGTSVVSATCGAHRKGLSLEKEGAELPLGLRCVDGKVWSNATQKHPEPGDRLDALMPQAAAPEFSRAIYTGEAVLVAVPEKINVTVQRYQCVEDRLIRTLTQ